MIYLLYEQKINNYFLELESLADKIKIEDDYNHAINKNHILKINTYFDKILNLSSISSNYAVYAFEMIFIICESVYQKSWPGQRLIIFNHIFNMMLTKNPISQFDFKNASIKIITSFAYENYKDRIRDGKRFKKKSTELGLSEENFYLIYKSYINNISRFDVSKNIRDDFKNELNELYKLI